MPPPYQTPRGLRHRVGTPSAASRADRVRHAPPGPSTSPQLKGARPPPLPERSTYERYSRPPFSSRERLRVDELRARPRRRARYTPARHSAPPATASHGGRSPSTTQPSTTATGGAR